MATTEENNDPSKISELSELKPRQRVVLKAALSNWGNKDLAELFDVRDTTIGDDKRTLREKDLLRMEGERKNAEYFPTAATEHIDPALYAEDLPEDVFEAVGEFIPSGEISENRVSKIANNSYLVPINNAEHLVSGAEITVLKGALQGDGIKDTSRELQEKHSNELSNNNHISQVRSRLVDKGLVERTGHARGTEYHLNENSVEILGSHRENLLEQRYSGDIDDDDAETTEEDIIEEWATANEELLIAIGQRRDISSNREGLTQQEPEPKNTGSQEERCLQNTRMPASQGVENEEDQNDALHEVILTELEDNDGEVSQLELSDKYGASYSEIGEVAQETEGVEVQENGLSNKLVWNPETVEDTAEEVLEESEETVDTGTAFESYDNPEAAIVSALERYGGRMYMEDLREELGMSYSQFFDAYRQLDSDGRVSEGNKVEEDGVYRVVGLE